MKSIFSTEPSRLSVPGGHRLCLALGLGAVLLGGCAALEQQSPDPNEETVAADSPDAPDPFTLIELATLSLVEDETADFERADDPPPPHLWERIIDRFEFAECAEDSRAREWALWFGGRDEYMERVLNRARPWLYDIANELERRDMPGELALLPIVESAYDPFAYSHGRASGAWQFLSATAREHGVEINDFYDGRRDVWVATRAALDYLASLHARFDDWNLALAAYNAGQGRVARAVRRNQARNRSTHWDALRLPRETLAYVPKLNGLGCLFANPAEYDFEIPVWDDRPRVERIQFEQPIDIVALSAEAGLEIPELVALNPGLNHHLTPPSGPHHLFVPTDRADVVREVLPGLDTGDMVVWEEIKVRRGDTLSHIARRHNTSVSELRETNGLSGDHLRAGQKLRIAANGKTPDDSPHAERYRQLASLQERLLPTRRFQHQVRPGENLWVIARRYGVSVSDIQRWNNLGQRSLLQPGQRLLIHMEQPGRSAGRRVEYTVQRGDSLWLIARRHQVTVQDLLRWNDLSEDAVLRPGQKLTIRREESA